MNYKRLGDYMQLVDNRNTDATITNLLGINITKNFMPSSIHDGSHDIADEIHVSNHDETLQRYKDVFRALFDANGQLGHYNQMMGVEHNRTIKKSL